MLSSGESYSEDESLSDLSDFEERPFFRKLDKYDTIEIKDIPIDDENTEVVFGPELRKQYIKKNDKLNIEEDKKKDQSYKEILKWQLELPPQNKVIFSSNEENKKNEEESKFKCELITMILSAQKKEKPEFEITLPEINTEETYKIMYPRNLTGSICDYTFSSYEKENEKETTDLKISQNYTILKKNDYIIADIKVDNGDKEEKEEPENSVVMVSELSKFREKLSTFQKDMKEFSEKSKFIARAFQTDKEQELGCQIKLVNQGIINDKKVYGLIKYYGNVNYNKTIHNTSENISESDSVSSENEICTSPEKNNIKPLRELPRDTSRKDEKYDSIQRILADEKRVLEDIKHFSMFCDKKYSEEDLQPIERNVNTSLEMQLAKN